MNRILATAERLDLDDALGSLQHARRTEDLGRLAHVAYWDVRRWARRAQHHSLAERAADLIIRQPHQSRAVFLRLVDDVIDELECIRAGDGQRHATASPGPAACGQGSNFSSCPLLPSVST